MSKEEYNIDSILSEVKKRREETEAAEQKAEAINETAEPAETAQEAEGAESAESDGEPSEKTEVLTDAAQEAEAAESAESDGEPSEKTEVLTETAQEAEAAEPAESDSEQSENMVNIMEIAEDDGEAEPEESDGAEPETEEPKGKKERSKTGKIITTVIIILLALIAVAGAIFAVKATDWLKTLEENNDVSDVTQAEWQGMKKLVENFAPIQETEASELSSLEDMVRTWYYNGSPCSSSHVLNVMLIGEDTRGKEILEDETRADAAIIASINTDTKEIVLTSILRDSWSYWETKPGDESTGQFGKLNGALSTGNLGVYINTVERLYKIKIDNYAIVNFTSFETIIDTLYKNGIELELTDAEINEINNHQSRYGHVTIEKTFEGTKGKMRLNGQQALAYCRIRHIDTDNARADRQKTTLMKIYEDFRDASTAKKMKLIDKLVPYLKTGFKTNEIIKIATYGMSHGWTGYDIHSFNYPTVNVTGGIYGSDFLRQWIWRADFPADAYDMQKRIYGKSSITLAKLRVDTKRVNQKGFYQDGARATDYYYTNSAYGEATTCVPYDEEEDEEETTE
ncbi:MAG: LCP family protein [Eubacterium sp.]|nr:LCP family protein [Eubacterium sp.]